MEILVKVYLIYGLIISTLTLLTALVVPGRWKRTQRVGWYKEGDTAIRLEIIGRIITIVFTILILRMI